MPALSFALIDYSPRHCEQRAISAELQDEIASSRALLAMTCTGAADHASPTGSIIAAAIASLAALAAPEHELESPERSARIR